MARSEMNIGECRLADVTFQASKRDDEIECRVILPSTTRQIVLKSFYEINAFMNALNAQRDYLEKLTKH
jgi:hypothetical protein